MKRSIGAAPHPPAGEAGSTREICADSLDGQGVGVSASKGGIIIILRKAFAALEALPTESKRKGLSLSLPRQTRLNLRFGPTHQDWGGQEKGAP